MWGVAVENTDIKPSEAWNVERTPCSALFTACWFCLCKAGAMGEGYVYIYVWPAFQLMKLLDMEKYGN